jgi:hypothetical protein
LPYLSPTQGHNLGTKKGHMWEKEHVRYFKHKDEYDKLYAKVQEIKDENIPVEKLNQTKLMILLRW